MQKLIHLFVSKIILFAFLLLGAESGAAQSGHDKTNPQSAPSPEENFVPALTLNEVIRQVELYHPKLAGAEIERRVAEAKLLEKQGAFDPVVNFNSGVLRYNSTTARGKVGTAYVNEATFEMATRSGIKFFGGTRYNFGQVKSPDSFTGTGGEYFAGAAMPILRNRNVNAKALAEDAARISTAIADANTGETRLDLITKAAADYWKWVASKQKLDINKNLFELSKQRAEQVRGRVAAGDLPPIDQIEANQEIQRRIGGVVQAERNLQEAALKLSLSLWTPSGDTIVPEVAQAPSKLTDPLEISNFVIVEGIQRAVASRPELQRVELNKRITELDSRLASNNRRPALDLYIAPGRDTGAFSIGTTLKFGATVSLPLRTREADGQLAAANLKLQKLRLEQTTERQRISTEIRDFASAVNASHNRFLLAQQELDLARTLERGERTRYELGDSTLFLVNQRERTSAETASKLVDIRAEYEQALAKFKTATLQY